jgi:predicted MFS family arabinose efflux permease
VFIAAGGLLAMFFFQTIYLQSVLGLSALETGLAFLPFSAAMGLATGIVSKLPQALDPRVPIAAGLTLAAAGLWLMAGLDPASAYAGDVLPTLIITGLGLGVAFVPVMGLATGDAEERDGGLASGLMTSAQQIGGAIGIAVMVTIATSQSEQALAAGAAPALALSDGFAAAFQVQAVVMLVAAVISVLVLGRGRRAAYPEPTAASVS